MPRLAAWALALARGHLGPLASAERSGLTGRLAACLVELIAQTFVVAFELGDALAELAVLLPQRLDLLGQCLDALDGRVRHPSSLVATSPLLDKSGRCTHYLSTFSRKIRKKRTPANPAASHTR